ncbi:1-phosphofructokinase family hexose kinase [Rhodobacteraceae bacterium CCMM004]|nr:1-phosphofructokinase family hexose kinase [Rhodobacteraceae bacterium CCMM004]
MRAHILTITLNPTVDFASTTEKFIPGDKLRCTEPHIDPGGGGINVARAIRLLGGQAVALVAIGGSTGAQLLQMLSLEGVATVAFQGPGETRQSISVIETASGQQLRFVMPGPSWREEDVARALASVDQATGDGTLVVLSGSQPPGVAKDFPSILAQHVVSRQARLIVDTSGPALHHLIDDPHGSVEVLRMDAVEGEELARAAHPRVEDTAAFAEGLVAKGVARNVIVARGADGSVLSNAEGSWHSVGAPVSVLSKVGAGDSFVGALTLALAEDRSYPEALRFGVAAASNAVMTEATRLCDRKTTDRLLRDCTLRKL